MASDERDRLTERCEARIGDTLGGKWTLIALVGVGGMAAVYAAVHRNAASSAIKILHPETAADVDLRERFLREAYIANSVGHPGAVQVVDDDVDEEGCPYLVMELLSGESVNARAKRDGGRLSPAEVLRIADETLAVLEAAHGKGIVHRDIKPDNLFLTKAGPLKVLDFGIARMREAPSFKRTATGTLLGTPAFMAPEQALARWADIDARTDLWAVGATMFKLLTGEYVHDSATLNELLVDAATRPARSLARVMPGAPLALVKLVDRALEYDRDQRFHDAASMRAVIAWLREELERPRVRPSSLPPREAPVTRTAPPPARTAPPPAKTTPPPAKTTPPPDARTVPMPARTAPPPPMKTAPPPPVKTAPPPPRTTAPPPPVKTAPPPPRTTAPPPIKTAPPPAITLEMAETVADAGLARPRADGGQPLAVTATEADIATMRELFSLMEKTMTVETQYGRDHPETVRRFDRLATQAFSAVAQTQHGMVWGVTPYSFFAGQATLWEPEEPWNRITYRLFADGVRVLGLLPGLTEQEFHTFLRILTIDPAKDLAPEDDLVTMLWDASFDHVVYHAIDSFSEGNQESRVKYERERQEIIDLGHADASEAIGAAYAARARRRAARSAEADAEAGERVRRLVERLREMPLDADKEAAARAGRLAVPEGHKARADLARPDPAVRQFLASRMGLDTGVLGDRFVIAAAHAYVEASRRGQATAVTAALKAAVEGLAATASQAAMQFVGALCKAVDAGAAASGASEAAEVDELRASLADAIVSKETLRNLITGAGAEAGGGGEAAERLSDTLEALADILGYLGGSHVPVALECLASLEPSALRRLLLGFVERMGRGHEAAMAALFAGADVELGLALVRILAAMDSPGARDAIAEAAHSPHGVVRIEALGHVEGTSSERLRMELRTLLEDRDPSVRLAALRTMTRYGIRVAGPFLVLRIRAPGFDALPLDERREALETVWALAPSRAEAVATEILADTRFLAAEAHEQSRELAADLLGRIARGPDAMKALTEASRQRLRGSERVRNAASKALEQIARRSQAKGSK